MTAVNIYFLINPKAGGRQGQRVFEDLKNFSQQHSGQESLTAVEQIDFTRLETQLEEAQKSEIIVIGGGDGTVSSVASKIKNPKCKIGILPLGTGNDLAREFNLQKLPNLLAKELVDFYQKGEIKQLSLFALERFISSDSHALSFSAQSQSAKLETLTFTNYASIGFDAVTVSHFAKFRANSFSSLWRSVWENRLAYALAGVLSLTAKLDSEALLEWKTEHEKTKQEPREQKTRQQKFFGRGLIFANIQSIMGLGRSNNIGSAFDDLVEIIGVRSILNYAAMIPGINKIFPQAQLFGNTKELLVSNLNPQAALQLDGEACGAIACDRIKIFKLRSIPIIC